MVQICSDRVLIVGVQAGSDGSGGFGRGAAAERAGGLPEFTKTGAPGVVSTRVWVGWHLRDMGKLLVPKAGLGR